MKVGTGGKYHATLNGLYLWQLAKDLYHTAIVFGSDAVENPTYLHEYLSVKKP